MSKILESAQKDPRKRSLDDDIRLMAGSMLTYSNLISTNEGTETQAVKMVVHKFRDKLLGCLMLPLAFTYFVLFSASIMLHEDIADVYLIESELRSNMDALFREVEDIDTLWDTLMGPFSQSLFKQTDMYGRTLTRPAATATDKWGNWGQVGVYNQIQGAVRFQQTRRTAAGFGSAYTCGSEVTCFLCRANRGFQPAFLESAGAAPIDCGDWPNATRRLSDEQPMDVRTSEEGRRLSLMQPTTLSSLPKESNNEMSIFRFYIYPSEDLTRSMERMQYFRSRNWLDKDSQVLQIRLYLMNSELGQPNLEQMTLTFYFADGGSVYYSRDFQAIFFEVFPNSFSLVADGLFFLTLCFTGVLQTIVLWRALRDRRMKKYLTDIRNLLELIVIAGGIYFCAQFYMVYLTKEETTEFITNLRAKGWNIYDAQQEDVEELFAKGESASSEILSLRLLAANYTLILTFRFFANFQAQPQLAIITNTLGSLIVEIVHFMVVFIPAFLVYVFSATLLFGRRIEDVSTFWGSMGYIFRMTQEGEYDWEAFQMENYWSSAIWVWSFVVFINMLLINLLIAIILDTYKELQKAEESREAVWNTMAQFWYRLIYVRRWVSELDVAKLCSDRYRPELLDKITMQEQFPQMPQHQLDLIFEDSAIQMQAQANKDINTEKLVKMAGSLMSSVSGVNDSLAEMMTEESRDSLQSWVVGKTPGGKARAVLHGLLLLAVQWSRAWLGLAHRGDRLKRWVVRQATGEQNALQEKARTEAAVLFGDSDLKLPDETALALRARARRRADWARKRLDLHTEDVLEDIPATLEGDRAQDVEREGNLIRKRVEAKRAKERQEAELKATTSLQRQLRRKEEKRLQAERWGSTKERRRAERMAQSHGVELPSLEEAHRMSVVQLRDALWNAGYPARGLPSPADARQLAPEELKERLQRAKVRFLSQLSHVLLKVKGSLEDDDWS